MAQPRRVPESHSKTLSESGGYTAGHSATGIMYLCIMVHITLDSGLQNPDAWWIPRTQHVCHEGMWDGGERTFKVVMRAPPRLPAPCRSCFVDHTHLGILIPVSRRQSCMDTQHNTTGIAHGAMLPWCIACWAVDTLWMHAWLVDPSLT